jgi:hypothetical protein
MMKTTYLALAVSLEVLVGGRPLPTIEHRGQTYLPVRLGEEYQIRVRNHGPRRITAVVSVDGISVITRRPASAADRGYIVFPRGHIVIKGWRRDEDTVRAFRFVDREESVAGRTGLPLPIGVIRLLAIEERAWRPGPFLEEKGGAGKARVARAGSVGTGSGREIDSRVYEVPFVRSANRRTLTIHYDTPEALRRLGVPVDDFLPLPVER